MKNGFEGNVVGGVRGVGGGRGEGENTIIRFSLYYLRTNIVKNVFKNGSTNNIYIFILRYCCPGFKKKFSLCVCDWKIDQKMQVSNFLAVTS